MAWLVHRNATSEDKEKLAKAARRFADRHGIRYGNNGEDAESAIQNEIGMMIVDCNPDTKYIQKLWFRCTERALNSKGAEGIAWDTVGEHADN